MNGSAGCRRGATTGEHELPARFAASSGNTQGAALGACAKCVSAEHRQASGGFVATVARFDNNIASIHERVPREHFDRAARATLRGTGRETQVTGRCSFAVCRLDAHGATFPGFRVTTADGHLAPAVSTLAAQQLCDAPATRRTRAGLDDHRAAAASTR
jgi:hypothetical protein